MFYTLIKYYKGKIRRKKIVVKKDNIYYILIYFHKKKLFNPDFSETTILVNGTNNEKPRYELSPLNLTTSHQDNSS